MLIPVVHCTSVRGSLDFYVSILGFTTSERMEDIHDPGFCLLERGGDRIILSSHRGDSRPGQAIVVLTEDVDAEYRLLLARGLRTPGRPDSPVHEAPVDQTWGSREFYVDDPDGNTLRFTEW